MKAAYYEHFQGPVTIETLPDPRPAADGVVIEVKANGVCRSDWHGWMGHDADINLPHVPGHELAGVVIEVGREVQNWLVGDRVTVPFCGGCGRCEQCRLGHQHICDNYFQPGFTHWGSFAEQVAVDHADINLVRLPDSMGFVDAALLGCRFITAFRAVTHLGRVQPEEWVVIHGCGGVGLSAVMIAAAHGAKVIAVDIDDAKLDFARTVGAAAGLNAQTEANLLEAIHDVTNGGAHLSLDALGSQTTCTNSIYSLRKRGRHLQVGLMVGQDLNPQIPMHAVISRELEIIGSHGMQAHAYGPMLAMIERGDLPIGRLLGQTITLEQAPAALMQMNEFHGVGATVIDF
ncbi:MAG: zinc-dependent alcohol dehydrogenase family protein [Ardenticatenaceae bacterium]|nr:zinc-dependent alcohol dehydrogenase family protein [Ardenticatenaceae bacterium]